MNNKMKYVGIYYFLAFVTLLCFLEKCDAKEREKIAVIDSGINYSKEINPYLCTSDHISFVKGEDLSDKLGHGSSVASLIAQNIDKNKFCLVIVKWMSKEKEFDNGYNLLQALEYVSKLKTAFANLSGGGEGGKSYMEFFYINKAVLNGTKYSLSSGNEGKNLDKECDYYPACYKFDKEKVHVVTTKWRSSSNRGTIVTHSEEGCGGIPYLCGTSMATAIHTGKWAAGKLK